MLFGELIKDAIKIDFTSEILYGRDQAYVSYPAVFPTVTFKLEETPAFEMIAERKRLEEPCDIYLGINGYTDSHVDTVIILRPDTDGYPIGLTLEEQDAIYDLLNEQCIKHLNKDLEELLAESRERI